MSQDSFRTRLGFGILLELPQPVKEPRVKSHSSFFASSPSSPVDDTTLENEEQKVTNSDMLNFQFTSGTNPSKTRKE